MCCPTNSKHGSRSRELTDVGIFVIRQAAFIDLSDILLPIATNYGTMTQNLFFIHMASNMQQIIQQLIHDAVANSQIYKFICKSSIPSTAASFASSRQAAFVRTTSGPMGTVTCRIGDSCRPCKTEGHMLVNFLNNS